MSFLASDDNSPPPDRGSRSESAVTISEPRRFDARTAWLDEEVIFDAKAETKKSPRRSVEVAQIALGALMLGVGWLVGANMYDRHVDVAQLQRQIQDLSARVARAQARASSASSFADVRSLRAKDTSLSSEVKVLRAKLEALGRQEQTRDAQMTASIVKIEKDPRFDQIAGRLDRLERQFSSSLTTASIPTKAPPAKPDRSAALPRPAPKPVAARAGEPARRPPAVEIQNYVLRGIDGGAALVEGAYGVQEIAPGDYLAGVGRVERIERRDGEWVVVTSRGYIEGPGD